MFTVCNIYIQLLSPLDIYYYKDRREKHELLWAGRIATQRDAQDQEPCYFIDIGLFKRL